METSEGNCLCRGQSASGSLGGWGRGLRGHRHPGSDGGWVGGSLSHLAVASQHSRAPFLFAGPGAGWAPLLLTRHSLPSPSPTRTGNASLPSKSWGNLHPPPIGGLALHERLFLGLLLSLSLAFAPWLLSPPRPPPWQDVAVVKSSGSLQTSVQILAPIPDITVFLRAPGSSFTEGGVPTALLSQDPVGIKALIEHAVPRLACAQWELSFSRRHFSLQRQHLFWAPAADLYHLSRGDTVQGVLG